MTENYKKRLIELAKEIHELQEEESKKLPNNVNVDVPIEHLFINSKINFLIGYILALEKEEVG